MSCNSNCDDTEVIIVTLNTGAPGSATGIPGPQGPQGEQGEQGPQGEPGIMSAVTGDVAITTTSVSTLATVGVAAIVGGAAQALTLQTDAKGRVLAVTAQQASITTAQIQSLVIPDLSNSAGAALATAGASGISGASARADHVHPFPTASEVGALGATAAAGGDLTGNFPNPTLAAVTTAQSSVGSASAVPVLTVDDKGRVTALNTVALNALTTQDIAGLTTQPAQSLGAVASAGVSPLAARGDHVHPLPSAADIGALGATAAAGGDLAGNFPNPTLAAITTAQSAVGSQSAIPVISIDAKGRVTALESATLNALTTQDIAGLTTQPAQPLAAEAAAGISTEAARGDHAHALPTPEDIGALSTNDIAGLSTTAPLSLAPSASAGTSDFAARADHVHALTTLGTPGTFGSGTVVPVLTVDDYGRVSAVTTTEITGGGGGASLTTQPAQALATTAAAGVSTEAARGDHVHPISGDVAAQLDGSVKVTALQSYSVGDVAPNSGQVLTWTGSAWVPGAPAQGGSGGGGVAYYLNAGAGGASPLTNLPGTPKTLGRVAEVAQTTITSGTLSQVTYDLVAGFVTAVGDPGLTAIPAGIWDFNIWASSNANSSNQTILQARLYKYDGTNAPTLLATSDDVSVYDPTVVAQYILALTVPQTTVTATDRLYVELLAKATANNRTVSLKFGDATPTHLHSTIPSVSGTGLVRVLDSVFQTPASLLSNADVAADAAIAQSKIAGLVAALDGKSGKPNRVKVVGVDHSTIQGCIDAITTAAYNAQWWVLIPPGEYTESLTLKPCVNLASIAQNNAASRAVRVKGVHTYAGSAVAANNYLQLSGLSLDGNTAGQPALSLTSTDGNNSLVQLYSCHISQTGTATTEVVVRVGAKVYVTAFNCTTNANPANGQGGTHWDINNGSLTIEASRTQYGTRAILMRGSDGTTYMPYLESRGCYWDATGSEVVKIDSTGTNALAVFGSSNLRNYGTAAPNNGIDIQAVGALVGASSTSYQVPVGASNYVVTGVVGSAYFEANNHYSNTAAAPIYSTQFGSNVARQQYATAFATTAMAAITTSSVVGLSSYPARADHSHALTTQSVANILSATAGAALTTTGIVGISSLVARADHTHALTTAGIGNVLSTTPGAALTTTGIAGTSAFAARVDHTHALTTQATGNVLTTTPGAALTTTAIAGVSPFVARVDHTHPLPTAVQIGALTTDQINSLSTATPATLTTSGVVGLSVYPARMDHSHAMATLGVAATYGSSSAVPVITTDAFGRVASVTTAAISGGGGGASLTTVPAANLTTTGIAGLSTEAARADHAHALTTSGVANIVSATAGAALTSTGIAGISPFVARVDHTHAIPTTFQLSTLFQAGAYTAHLTTQGEGVLSGGNLLIGQSSQAPYIGRTAVKESQLTIDETLFLTGIESKQVLSSITLNHSVCSSDGKVVAFSGISGGAATVYVSTNYGASYGSRSIGAGVSTSSRVAMSVDGKYISIAATGGTLSVSSDFGATFVSKDSARAWQDIDMSADGRRQIACTNASGFIYVSSNFGQTWTQVGSATSYTAVACSSDGRVMFALNAAGQLYISTNFGSSFTTTGTTTGSTPTALICSANGQNVYVANDVAFEKSSNFGATFGGMVAIGANGIINASADGKFIASAAAGILKGSTDFGATFATKDSSVTWVTCAVSSDGKIVHAATASTIYRSASKSSLLGSIIVSEKAAIGVALTTTETASLAVGSGGIKAWNAALTAAPTITVGDATPEGAVTAPVGSLFLRTNGGANTTLYVKESGTGNTGWVGK